MKRYYYLSTDINNTVQFEHSLLDIGVDKQHIHVYGISDSQAQRHKLTPVLSIFKTDVVHYLLRGLLLGLLISALLVLGLWFTQLPNSVTLALAGSLFVTGLITWEAGLIGFQKENYKLSPLKRLLKGTNHLVLVDVDDSQAKVLCRHTNKTQSLTPVAVGSNLVNPFADQETLLV